MLKSSRKIFFALVLVSASAAAFSYSTGAFFSDTETSTDNTFEAGAIDLKIGNSSYYNGEEHATTTWSLGDLDGQLFFDFDDLKPGDLAEDTIEVNVDNNPSWLCSNITLTSSSENEIIEPEETAGDTTEGNWDGELDEQLNFVFWADDGDNVLEDDETVLLEGSPADLPQGEDNEGLDLPIVDSTYNAFEENPGDPLPGLESRFIGKAWCFGELTLDPVGAGDGVDPTVEPGVSCNGNFVTNTSQTDELTGNITFTAVQARNNDNYTCAQGDSLLWIIGDEEENQEDNPVDELNFVAFANFPEPPAIGDDYTRIITSPIDDAEDEEFPWNTNYISDYARNIDIEFSYPGPTTDVKLTVGWSPGRSAGEQKEVFLDAVSLGTTPVRNGVPVAGWWEQMRRFQDEFTFELTPGSHTIRIEHLSGDGTLWDFIKLEKL